MLISKLRGMVLVIMLLPLLFAAPVFADSNPTGSACSSANGEGQSSSICQPSPGGSNANPVINIINDAANIIAIVTGVAAVIMIIIGGFTMITSGGNAEAQASARRRIIYSALGLVIVALAWSITRFITDKVI